MFAIGAIVILCGIGVVVFVIIKIRCCNKSKKEFLERARRYIQCDKFEQSQCPICLDEFETGCEVRKIKKCKHLFHANCIEEYTKRQILSNLTSRKCPICRSTA